MSHYLTDHYLDAARRQLDPIPVEVAAAELAELGYTAEQVNTLTGLGLRRLTSCRPVDTIAAKYAAGALTAAGVAYAVEHAEAGGTEGIPR